MKGRRQLKRIHALWSATLLANRRQHSKSNLWRHLTNAGCLLLGLMLCLTVAAVFELQDDELRRNTLNVLATLATVAWIGSGTIVRVGMSSIFDYRQLVPLPVAFGILYGMRVAAGLSGLWLLIFGPALLYLLAYETVSLAGFTIALLASLALVVTLGRLVSIALLKTEDLSASWIATVLLMVAIVATLFTLEPAVQKLISASQETPVASVIAEQIRESQTLETMAYLPGGLLVGIFNAPQALGANLARLAGLWLVALACMALEYRILSRQLLDSLPTKPAIGGIHISLAPILRRVQHLTPDACLRLIEVETLMRTKWYRGMILATLFLLPVVQTGSVYVLVWSILMFSAAFLNVRANSFGVAHRNIGERFALPMRLTAPARAYSAAVTVLPSLLFSATICWAWYRTGWPGTATLSLWLALPFCILVGGHGAGVLQSARSPMPFDFTPYSGKLPSSSPPWSSVAFNVVVISLPLLLAFVAPRTPWGPAAAVCGSVVLVVGATIFTTRTLGSAERLVRSDPHRLLDSLAGRK